MKPEESSNIVPVVIVGKNRTRMTCAVIDHIKKHMKNAKPFFVCVSDRSREGHDEVIRQHLRNIGEINFEVLKTKPENDRYGWGAAINIGLEWAFGYGFTNALVVDNDWLLQQDLDMEKYAYAISVSGIGAVTFKPVNRGTNVTLEERTFPDIGKFLYRSKGAEERYSFTAEIGCMVISKRMVDAYGKFKENCRTDETEWGFCNWYNGLTTEEKEDKGLWFVTDASLYHEELNGEGHVFTHVGLHSQHEGPHKWNVPEEYLDLSDDEKDATICKEAYCIPAQSINVEKHLHQEQSAEKHSPHREDSGFTFPVVIVDENPASEKIEWGKYFDKIYCLCLLQREQTRLSAIKDELARIDLITSPVFEWDYGIKTSLENPLFKDSGWRVPIPSYISYCIQYLKVLKKSELLGYKRIMIIEDDVVFLKDKSAIINILEKLPNTPCVQLEKSIWSEEDKEFFESAHKEDGFLYSSHGFMGSGCNVFTREGVLSAIDMLEKRKWCTDHIGEFLGEKCAVAIKPMCVQLYYANSEAAKRTSATGCHIGYVNQGIDDKYTDYSVPEGYHNGVFLDAHNQPTSNSSGQGETDVVIDWEKYFDKIYCLSMLPDSGRRFPRLKEELIRVGLLDSPVFEIRYDTKTNLETPLKEDTGWATPNPNYKAYALRYVKLLKESLYLGFKRILVIEDDVAFLKDKSEILKILNATPDAPVVQYDKFIWNLEGDAILQESRSKGLEFFKSARCFASAACNAYNRQGMELVANTIEQQKCAIDQIGNFISDSILIATKNLTVQVFYDKSESHDSLSINATAMHECYTRQGIDDAYSNYAVPEGYNSSLYYKEPIPVNSKNEIPDNHWEMHSFRNELVNLVKSLGKPDIRILEIGSCMGDSAEAFLLSGLVSNITCVDTWEDIVSENLSNCHSGMEEKEKIFDATMSRFGDKVKKFKGTFEDFIASRDFVPFLYDIVYIDALHDYESVKQNIEDTIRHIKPILGIAGHDYYPDHQWMGGVAKAVDEKFNGAIRVFNDSSWLHVFSEDEKKKMRIPEKKGRKFVSVYAIAKNEASVAKRWYECVKEADEVCVLDTGSIDDTVKILRELGAKVEVKTYDDWSFAVARNDSMKLVSPESEILFTLDLDETIAPGWRNKLEDAWIAEEEKGNKPAGVLYKYIWSFYPDGTEAQSFSVRKIHANGKGKWKYRCHELLTEVDGYTFFLDGFVVEHHQNTKTNRSKYLPLLKKDAEEMPQDDRSAYYYARELMYCERWHEAIQEFKRHLELSSAGWICERASSMRNIAFCYKQLKSEGKCELWLWKAAEEDPTNREATFRLGEMAMERKDYRTAVKVLKRCLDIEKPSLEYISDPTVWSARPAFLYAQALWWTGRWDEAVEMSKKALEIEPNNKAVRSQYEGMLSTRDAAREEKV